MYAEKATADARLDAATADLRLTEGEERILGWVKGFDAHTVSHLAAVIEKARGQLREAAGTDDPPRCADPDCDLPPELYCAGTDQR